MYINLVFAAFALAASAHQQPDPALAAQLAAEAAAVQGSLPIKQGPLTVTGIRAKGPELIFDMQIDQDITEDQQRVINEQMPLQACANPTVVEVFRRGGVYTYHFTDTGGDRFSVSVSRC